MIAGHHRAELNEAAQKVVRRVCRRQWGGMSRPPTFEPDFVASLVVRGADLLQKEWEPILARQSIEVKVAGVFCHQSPMVDITARPPYDVRKRRCELADLLVLLSHSTSNGRVFRRGILIQAKYYLNHPVKAEEPQLWLYRDWPTFVIDAPGFKKQKRDFGGDRRSGHYALVSNNGWRVLPASTRLAWDSLASVDLSEFLVHMLYDVVRPSPAGLPRMEGRSIATRNTTGPGQTRFGSCWT
jgi:hypothetical protein